MSRGASDQYLLFRSRAWVGALALDDVREVMRPLPMELLAGAPAFVAGVAVIRGIPSPVVDAAQLLAAGTEPQDSPARYSRFISLKLGARSACLAVEAVLDIRRLPAEALRQTPPLLRASGATLLPQLGALDRELLIVLNGARLVPDSVWASMQSSGTPG